MHEISSTLGRSPLLGRFIKVGVTGLRAEEGEIGVILNHMSFVVEEESATVGGVVQCAPRFRSVGPSVDPETRSTTLRTDSHLYKYMIYT